MPFYEIQHHCPIGPSQRKELAQKLTQLHATAFDTPTMFVNIRFRLMDFGEENFFVGGESRFRTNQIFVYIRSGPERISEVFDKLAADIEKVWDEVLGGGYRKMFQLPAKEGEEKLPPDERKEGDRLKEEAPKLLQGVFIIPGLTIREEGFGIPLVGGEKAWIQQNWARFKERENAGDRVIESLLKDANSRTSLGGKDEVKAEIRQEHEAARDKGGNNEGEEMDHERKREFERQHSPKSEVVPRP